MGASAGTTSSSTPSSGSGVGMTVSGSTSQPDLNFKGFGGMNGQSMQNQQGMMQTMDMPYQRTMSPWMQMGNTRPMEDRYNAGLGMYGMYGGPSYMGGYFGDAGGPMGGYDYGYQRQMSARSYMPFQDLMRGIGFFQNQQQPATQAATNTGIVGPTQTASQPADSVVHPWQVGYQHDDN